jgi:hypothetical protein
MIKIGLDMLVLAGMLAILQGEEPEWFSLFFVALGLSIVGFVFSLFAPVLGVFVLVPIVIVDTIVLMFFCHLPIKQALIVSGVLLAYNLAFILLYDFAFGMPTTEISLFHRVRQLVRFA